MDSFEWPRIRNLICTELQPARLAERIAVDRARHASYAWTSLPLVCWQSEMMPEPQFDDAVRDMTARIERDYETSAVLRRLEELGFRYLLGSFDEPGLRLFHINVNHDDRAEQLARGD